MLLKVSTRGTRLLLLVSLASAFFLGYYSIRTARAAHAVELNTRWGYEQAVRLEPKDPQNWFLLGRFYLYDFDQPDPDGAMSALQKSRSLFPNSSDTLLEIATNYGELGKDAEARAAYLDAKRVYPFSAEVHWRYGNFLLRQNEIPEAFLEIRRAVELEPERGAEAFSRCSRVVSDPDEILDKAIPPSFESYMRILFDLAHEGKVDTALKVWSRANALPGAVQMEEIAVLANALVQEKRGKDADVFWRQATQKMPNPIPLDPPGSAIWDGGFESNFRFGGLGWSYEGDMQGIQVALDQQEKHSGNQSLRLMFLGKNNVNFVGVCHVVPVTPGQDYDFSAWIKTKLLTTEQGVRFTFESRAQGRGYSVVTDEIHGDQPWTNITMPWTAPPEAQTTRICMARRQSGLPDGDIKGTAWIDDVTLTAVAKNSQSSPNTRDSRGAQNPKGRKQK